MSRLKKNLGYQTIYQILNTSLPLITSPYLARVLGAEKQGVFSFTQSVVNYFTLVAMLGVVNYGTRTIAASQTDREKRSRDFWNIYALQFCVSVMAIIAYLVYLLLFCSDNVTIATIQGLYLFGCIADINWLFFGVEKFNTTVTRSILIRITSVVLILLAVKRPDDLWIYTTIMAGSVFLSNAVLWLFASKEIDFSSIKYISFNSVISHVKPNIILFIPLLAMSVYHIMDKTMLGLLSSYTQVGYYYNADKIINIPIGVIGGVGTVMLPRMTSLIESNKREESNELFLLSVEAVFAVSSAMAFGIACISNEFTPLFFGAGFEPCINLIIVLAPVLIVKGLSQTSRMQFLIPRHKESIFLQSVVIGAITNLVVNYILIKQLGAMGAVIGTLLAELVTCIWQYACMSKLIKTGKTIIRSIWYLAFGTVMFISVRLISKVLPNGFIGIIIEVIIGATIYAILCLFFWRITKSSLFSVILRRKS